MEVDNLIRNMKPIDLKDIRSRMDNSSLTSIQPKREAKWPNLKDQANSQGDRLKAKEDQPKYLRAEGDQYIYNNYNLKIYNIIGINYIYIYNNKNKIN